MHRLTLRWVAPEVLAGSQYGKAADVYAFGVIMWEILTWQVPWDDLGPWQVQPCPCQRLVTRTLHDKALSLWCYCLVHGSSAHSFPTIVVMIRSMKLLLRSGMASH